MYYLARGGQQTGPYSVEQLRSLAAQGQMAPTDLVWTDGMSDWVAANSVPGIFAAGSAVPPAFPPQTVQPMRGAVHVAQVAPATPVPNYLWQAIACTLCCCLPFGIVAIVYASQVNTKLAAGDFAGAKQSSDNAKTWCWVSFGIGAVVGIISFIANFAAAMQQSQLH